MCVVGKYYWQYVSWQREREGFAETISYGAKKVLRRTPKIFMSSTVHLHLPDFSREMIKFWNLKFNNCGKHPQFHRILTSSELKLWTSTHYLHLSSWPQPSSSPSPWSQLCRILTSFYEALNITAQLECAKKGMDFFPLWFLFAIVAMNILLVIEDFVRVISFSIFEVLGKRNVFLYWGLI